jgi:signal transduction histidine kinase
VRRRLRRGYVALAVVLLLSLQVPMMVFYARSEYRELAGQALVDAQVLADRSSELLGLDDFAAIEEMARFQHEQSGAVVAVFDATATLRAQAGPTGGSGPEASLADHPDVVASLEGQRISSAVSYERHPGWLSVAVPVLVGEEVLGAVDLTVPTGPLDRRMRVVALVLLAFSALVIGGVVLLSDRLAGWLLQPVERLERVAHAWGAGDFEQRADITGAPPEIERLAATFDDMADRLGRSMAAQRAFVADASHQLKLPLTAHRLRLENLEEHLRPQGRAALDELMDSTDRFCHRLDELLVLAKAEASAVPLQLIDVPSIVQHCLRLWGPHAAARGVTLRAEVVAAESDAGEAPWIGSIGSAWEIPGATQQILDNLVSNACKASPPGSSVGILIRPSPHAVDLTVTDEGPGMSPEERQRAHERFWRGVGSYSNGSGLGLSIAYRLAAAMRGEIRLDQADGGGLAVHLRLQGADRRSRPR